MGKSLIQQARGRGGPRYRTPPRKIYQLEFSQKNGYIHDILHDQIRSAPIASVHYEDGSRGYLIAPEGAMVGDALATHVRKLRDMELGQRVFAIELYPLSGPKLCLASGSSATIMTKEGDKVAVQMPSKKRKVLSADCMAIIGTAAGEGKAERPWLKAGTKYHAMKAKGHLYPRSGAVNFNAVDHPFGGNSGPGQSKSVSRHAPPGAKVGSLAPRRTGRRKR
ncbi:MAG: 50S ribosomal protein L2 [Candidatus Aenigmarchaeota archaeon]|nr:50S ribosomal protein L2 [Candidatus Aenigmarchaeota archaeon]